MGGEVEYSSAKFVIPAECLPSVTLSLEGVDPVTIATQHGRGLHPIVVYDADSDEASFPVNVDAEGNVSICSKIDLTGQGYTVVIR